MRNTTILFSIFFLLILINIKQPGIAQVSGTKINYRCWISLSEGGETVKGFLVELRDSTVVVATNDKRPKTSKEIISREIHIREIQKIALRKSSRNLEASLLLGSGAAILTKIILSNQNDDLFSSPAVAGGIGLVLSIPFGALGALVGSPKKSFSLESDLDHYKNQRNLMRRHMRLIK